MLILMRLMSNTGPPSIIAFVVPLHPLRFGSLLVTLRLLPPVDGSGTMALIATAVVLSLDEPLKVYLPRWYPRLPLGDLAPDAGMIGLLASKTNT